MRRSRKRTETRSANGSCLAFLALALLFAGSGFADDYALVFGTVFQPTGHAMPGADVILQPEAGKAQRTKSSSRGEFTFRVAAKPARYTVTVKASGYRTESNMVSIQANERADITFLLEIEK